VEAVRDAVGPEVELLVEMHGRFAPAVAIALARELEPFQPGWIEEPVPPENVSALRKVADHVRLPIATGERIHVRHEFRELFELQAADVVQPDITMCGGITEARKIAGWADAYYVLVAPHNVGGPVSTAAALHFAAATPNFKIQEHFNDFGEAYVKEAATGNPEVVDGYFAVPAGPGLGVTLHEDLVRDHPRRTVHFDLYSQDWHLRQAERTGEDDVLPQARP
jgi:galactonate dehydratase